MTAPLSRAIYTEYVNALEQNLPTLGTRLGDITNGRVAPATEDLAIGSARNVTAAIIFFDIRGFTARTSSSHIDDLKATLFMLNCVIPAMMRVLYRHSAYVEKNTGDGLMAVLGVDMDERDTAKNALSACSEMMFVLHSIVNPLLIRHQISPIDARIGVDMGQILLARIGMPRGAAAHDRSTLTAVGPAANIACKLQGMAGTNEIYCGDKLRINSDLGTQLLHFRDVTPPPQNWNWVYGNSNNRYFCWKYDGATTLPPQTILGGLF